MRITTAALTTFAATTAAAQDLYWVMACSEPHYKGTCVNTTAPADTCSYFPDDTPPTYSLQSGWKWTGVFYNSTGQEDCAGNSLNVDGEGNMADMSEVFLEGLVPVNWRADSGAGN